MALEKSAWCLVDYKWMQGKWKCTNPGQNKIIEATNKNKITCPTLVP